MGSHSPEMDEVWRHERSGHRYVVLARATNKDPDGPTDGVVIYHPWGKNDCYVRSVANFLARFRYEQTLEPRSLEPR
jgi:hypothetical protein